MRYRQPAVIIRTRFWLNRNEGELPTRTTVVKWAHISQGPAPDMYVTGFAHLTFNANGDLTAFKREPTTMTCSG